MQLPCGHSHTTNCSAARALKAAPHTCPATVQLQLAACGHTLSCKCGDAAAKVLVPRACEEPCGALLTECLHSCKSSCGGCKGLVLGQLVSGWVQAMEQQQQPVWQQLAGVCQQKMQGPTGTLQLLAYLQEKEDAVSAAKSAVAGGRIAARAGFASSSTAGGLQAAALKAQDGTAADVAVREGLRDSWLDWLKQMGQSTAGGGSSSTTADAASTTGGVEAATAAAEPAAATSGSSSSSSGNGAQGSFGSRLRNLFKRSNPPASSATGPQPSSSAPAAATAAAPAATDDGSTTHAAEVQNLDFPASFRLRHPACRNKCSKKSLSCGHPCSSSCHTGKRCPPCTIRCPVSCSHTKCGQLCHKPCFPCAEPCTWRCPHQGACSLPCGAPCDRLPCNFRCEKQLKCGHRCPGLCGEKCLEGYCIHPKCRAKVQKAKPWLIDQVRFLFVNVRAAAAGAGSTCASCSTMVPDWQHVYHAALTKRRESLSQSVITQQDEG